MDVMLQAHEAKRVYPVPDGLRELSSDIVREVLRHQPTHINGFIAEYLETMLLVRERARDSAFVVSDIYSLGHLLDNLQRKKGVSKEMAHKYSTIITSAWRGYVVRKKLTDWLKKKKKFQKEKEERRQIKIEEFLTSIGISLEEAERAASIIQSNFRATRRGGDWVEDEARGIPLRQRIMEGDRALGRFDRWDKLDFGEFFDMTEGGEIIYNWPKVGQLRKIPKELVSDEFEIVHFFGMRDNSGNEQYSYLKARPAVNKYRGVPIGFLIPLPKKDIGSAAMEVVFTDPVNCEKMGNYTYIFQDNFETSDLEKFVELLGVHAKLTKEMNSETKTDNFDYDPQWVVPRALIQIEKKFLITLDDEVHFVQETSDLFSTQGSHTFRAETIERTQKILEYLLSEKEISIREALAESANISLYKPATVGRLLPVDNFHHPKSIQKIVILPESDTGEAEMDDMDKYEYVFLKKNHKTKKLPGFQKIIEIPITRFQGYHRDYEGSSALEPLNKVFILGPTLTSPDGKHFNHDSLFWEDFGLEAWFQFLHEYSTMEEEDEEIEEEEGSIVRVGEYLEDEQKYETEDESKPEIPGEMTIPGFIEESEIEDLVTADVNVVDETADEIEEVEEAVQAEQPEQAEQMEEAEVVDAAEAPEAPEAAEATDAPVEEA